MKNRQHSAIRLNCWLAYPLFFYAWAEPEIECSDDNVFFLPNTGRYRVPWINPADDPDGNTFDRGRELGFDMHSIFGDTRFANPDFAAPGHEDVRLEPDSPALALGFQPIDLTPIGIRSQ